MSKSRKNVWVDDQDKKFEIDPELIKTYFNKTLSLVFGPDKAKKEEKTLLPFIKLNQNAKVLDLGCGNGRWAKILLPKISKYIGVDVSKEFIKLAEKTIKDEKAGFVCLPAQNYLSDEKFDLVLVIGLITYMNDEDIRKLSLNCKKMLKPDGRLILRNVTLEDSSTNRKFYNYEPNWIRKLIRKPKYQVIRRTVKEELSLFREFELLHTGKITDAGYRFYILK